MPPMAYNVDENIYVYAQAEAVKLGVHPGVFCMGWILGEELRLKGTQSLDDPFKIWRSVAILGELPIDRPEWVDGLVEKIPNLLPDVLEKANRKDLTVVQVAGILARGMQMGYLGDYYGLAEDELPPYSSGQLKIQQRLLYLANQK